MKHLITLLCTLLVFTACKKDEATPSNEVYQQQQNMVNLFLKDSVTQMDLKVYYEHDATPYTGPLGAHDTWDVTHESLVALFQNHPARTITEPHVVSAMTKFNARNKLYWTPTDLLELASELNHDLESGTTVRPLVVFVKGYYDLGGAGALGVQLTGYPIAFIFKDAIRAVGGTPLQQKYLEQSVVVHELGHALGLVNLGIPVLSGHEDSSHLGHTSDADCVMNWKVDNAPQALSQIQPWVNTNRLNLFGTKSLDDAQAYHP